MKGPVELIISGDKPCKKGFCKVIVLFILKNRRSISKIKHLGDREGQEGKQIRTYLFTKT